MSNVVKLPATSTMTVEMALDHAKDRGLTECIVCGYDAGGELVVYSSRMDRQNALWLVEAAKDWVRDA
ncbi:MAG: hypothetical protein KGL90_15535 [Burkholderiales bacterium]|nr:hypothetical protein [Burkholderiales bacterium]